MLFGHLAVAALQHRYTKSALVPVTAAAVFPDAVDKVAHYVLGYNATGRMWGHTLIAAGLTSWSCCASSAGTTRRVGHWATCPIFSSISRNRPLAGSLRDL